ncbi:Group II intron maturase-specific domain protein [Thiorhodococcus drewsii AZ1]|uniref:Group II intron maturase-specific domain protein n=1 Tax=Thiorhodococcus drewsii AZ1 TaxID=765913 RepID=G2E2H5_9GAMM|nr:group II intron maturase-specific domain-containing protein [Thiorhodococcus drewsii]EGV30775.1 Group II intron maturase-specific domain protein [Thiorhodococcus drewsii AZ1]
MPKKVCRTISELTSRRWLLLDPAERVGRLNRTLIGWANYFFLGPVSNAYRAVDQHAHGRLRWWLCNKHKQPGQGTARFPDSYLY